MITDSMIMVVSWDVPVAENFGALWLWHKRVRSCWILQEGERALEDVEEQGRRKNGWKDRRRKRSIESPRARPDNQQLYPEGGCSRGRDGDLSRTGEARPIGARGAFASNSMHYASIVPYPTLLRLSPSRFVFFSYIRSIDECLVELNASLSLCTIFLSLDLPLLIVYTLEFASPSAFAESSIIQWLLILWKAESDVLTNWHRSETRLPIQAGNWEAFFRFALLIDSFGMCLTFFSRE